MKDKIKLILEKNKSKELEAGDWNGDIPLWYKRDFHMNEIWDEMHRLKSVIKEIEDVIENN